MLSTYYCFEILEIHTNFKFSVDNFTRKFVELDIWVPSFSIGFEFQVRVVCGVVHGVIQP